MAFRKLKHHYHDSTLLEWRMESGHDVALVFSLYVPGSPGEHIVTVLLTGVRDPGQVSGFLRRAEAVSRSTDSVADECDFGYAKSGSAEGKHCLDLCLYSCPEPNELEIVCDAVREF